MEEKSLIDDFISSPLIEKSNLSQHITLIIKNINFLNSEDVKIVFAPDGSFAFLDELLDDWITIPIIYPFGLPENLTLTSSYPNLPKSSEELKEIKRLELYYLFRPTISGTETYEEFEDEELYEFLQLFSSLKKNF